MGQISESSKSFGQGCFQVLVFMEAKAGNKGVSRDANSNNISVRDNIHTDYSVNQNKLQKLRELELIVNQRIYGLLRYHIDGENMLQRKRIASIIVQI